MKKKLMTTPYVCECAKMLSLTTLFLLSSLTMMAQITVQVKNQTVKSVLSKIEAKSSYKILYSSNLPGLDQKVDFNKIGRAHV